MILVVVEHDRGRLADAAREAFTAARSLAAQTGAPVAALTIGDAADGLAGECASYGATHVYQAHHALLSDYGPETWGEVIAQLVTSVAPSVVLATGTDRGNEVLAQAAARLDLPMAANCTEWRSDPSFELTRVRWGGSLLEDALLTAVTKLLTVAHRAFEAASAIDRPAIATTVLAPRLDPMLARSTVRDRVEQVTGVTLATARVVVGGGRGVGSAAGFAPLEELAGLLGGAVGCSRAVTNNGWRNHSDQVGQTGTRIAPVVYFACGISGAIQHWVGAMASRHIIAINTDKDANMVTRAGYAVIGDLHQVLPAITAEIRRRLGGSSGS